VERVLAFSPPFPFFFPRVCILFCAQPFTYFILFCVQCPLSAYFSTSRLFHCRRRFASPVLAEPWLRIPIWLLPFFCKLLFSFLLFALSRMLDEVCPPVPHGGFLFLTFFFSFALSSPPAWKRHSLSPSRSRPQPKRFPRLLGARPLWARLLGSPCNFWEVPFLFGREKPFYVSFLRWPAFLFEVLLLPQRNSASSLRP